MAKVDIIQRNLVKTIDLMKKNLEKFKKADDENVKKRHAKIAYKLQDKKKQLEKDLDDAIIGIHADAELQIDEVRRLVKNLIKETIYEADVFASSGGETPSTSTTSTTSTGDQEKDVAKLQKKFEGPMKSVIDLINTKDELHQAIQLILSKVEQNKPGLGKKAKILLKKSVNEL